nr:hypothetical transcript [Hymenolepis microstoma]
MTMPRRPHKTGMIYRNPELHWVDQPHSLHPPNSPDLTPPHLISLPSFQQVFRKGNRNSVRETRRSLKRCPKLSQLLSSTSIRSNLHSNVVLNCATSYYRKLRTKRGVTEVELIWKSRGNQLF